MANRFLSNIKINDAYTFPASDGSNGQVIVTDGAGNLTFANPTTSSSASVIYRDNFTGDGSAVAFTLQNSLSDEDQTFIYIDGVYQEKDNYSLSDKTITFTTAPPNGDSVEVISISGINVGPTTIYQDNFTGDGSTTEFNMAQSVDNEVKTMIYFNGVYQFKGTYSVNGTLITFDTAPSNGVAIEVISIASAAAGEEAYSQEVLFYGKASGAISKGDAVMFAGAQGSHFLFAKATQAAVDANHEYLIGLATQDLANNEFGYVTEFGNISGLNTSSYTPGDILWFDSGGATAGALTTTAPAPPLAKVQVAAVIRSHSTQGVIFVRPTWYHGISELQDVSVTSVSDKDLLVWNAANGYWENSKTVDTLTANTLSATTLTGTLSTAAQTNITSVGTLSSLAVSGNLTVDTNTLYVDATNNRVGIGELSPETKLHISDSVNPPVLRLDYDKEVATWTPEETITELQSFIGDSSGIGKRVVTNIKAINEVSGSTTAAALAFFTSASNSNVTERMRIDSSGNVGIGTDNPATTLDVAATTPTLRITNTKTTLLQEVVGNIEFFTKDASTGASRILSSIVCNTATGSSVPEGNLVFKTVEGGAGGQGVSATERMRIDSSGRVGIGTTSPSEKLDVQGDVIFGDYLKMGSSASYMGYIGFNRNTGNGNIYNSSYGAYQVQNFQGELQFQVYNSAGTQQGIHRFSNNGNVSLFGSVGIGTTTPNGKFTTVGTYATVTHSLAANTAISISSMGVNSSNFNAFTIGQENSQNNSAVMRFKYNGAGSTSNYAGFGFYANDDILNIRADGSVGIGTISPSAKLDVYRGSSGVVANFNGVNAYGAETGITLSQGRAKISGFLNTGGGTPGSNLRFYTMPDGGSVTERMRIHSNGDITFCKTDTSVDTNGVFIQAGSDGAIYSSVGSPANTYHVYNTLNNRYDFYVSYNGTIYARNATVQSLSDERLKENIQDLIGSLDIVTSLRPRVFDFKDGSKLNSKGFVAQEVEQVLPECVKEFTAGDPLEDGTRYKTVGQDFMPYIVGAIKELKEIIDNQQQEINDLKQRILTLENSNNG